MHVLEGLLAGTGQLQHTATHSIVLVSHDLISSNATDICSAVINLYTSSMCVPVASQLHTCHANEFESVSVC